MTREDLRKIAMCYAHDELKDNHGDVEGVVASAFMDGANYADAHPHWISVEDEYPKEEQLVLACNTKGFFMPAKYSDGIWWFYWNLKSQLLDVVYWMPMPTLPNDYLAEASKEAHRIILEKQPKGGKK